ncbi:MAG: RNA polymerase sigma factor [Candidatus Limnocylindrales bacterium]
MFWRAGERAAARPVPFDADRPAVEAARRDARAFEPLYRKYVAQVYSYAIYELHDPHRAEDVTAGVFVRALTALPRFHEAGEGDASSFRVWLFRIARNLVANERRHDRRHPQTDLEGVFELIAADEPATRAEERETVAMAWRAIDRLPEERRRALVLRFVEEMSTNEIAAILGRSEGAVRVLIHRALRAVAADLRRGRGPRP